MNRSHIYDPQIKTKIKRLTDQKTNRPRHGKGSNPSADTFCPQLKFPQNNNSKFPQNNKNCNKNHIL